MLTEKRIEELANQEGVRKNAVLNFLSSLDPNGKKSDALMNLDMDKRLYRWNITTVRIIRKGITEFYK